MKEPIGKVPPYVPTWKACWQFFLPLWCFLRFIPLALMVGLVLAVLYDFGQEYGAASIFWHDHWPPTFTAGLSVTMLFAVICYVALLFAVLHIGYLSLIDVGFVFIVGLLFGWLANMTGSLVGVIIAHGIAL